MPTPLLTNLWKRPDPHPPGEFVAGSIPPTANVGGPDSVPIELHLEGISLQDQVGVDIIFLIDNSATMDSNDSDNKRYAAIRDLCLHFMPTRDHLDRIAIILFQGDRAEPKTGWVKWSETLPVAIDLFENADGTGGTPMAHGIKTANDFHIASNGYFKLDYFGQKLMESNDFASRLTQARVGRRVRTLNLPFIE